MKNLKVAVMYGGTNTEHEISIITALQVMHALIEAGHQVYPIYISKQNQWLLGNDHFLKPTFYHNFNRVIETGKKCLITNNGKPTINIYKSLNRISAAHSFDIAFPIFHGRFGEDGTIQGFLTAINIPIAGPSLTVTTIGVDKYISKRLASSINIPVVPDIFVSAHQWQQQPSQVVSEIKRLGQKWIIKPNTSGSSIGLALANSEAELFNALNVALSFDTGITVEPALTNFSEVNISILGNGPYQVSVTEAPVRSTEILTFKDKYSSNHSSKLTANGMASAKRHIPAPLKRMQLKAIETYAQNFFTAIHGRGLSRIDFLLHRNTIYFNEINPIPGSLAYYLWEKSNLPFPQLVDQLLELGIQAWHQDNATIKTFDSNILSQMQIAGLKT